MRTSDPKKIKAAATRVEQTPRLVAKLCAKGESPTSIAAALNVSYTSILRWKEGRTSPHQLDFDKLAQWAKTGVKPESSESVKS